LLKIVLVKLNCRISVYINFTQSRIPALVCSLQSEYGCNQARSQKGQQGQGPQFQSFQVNKLFEVQAYFSAN